MENEPVWSDASEVQLREVVRSFLVQDGMVLADRETIIPLEMIAELDATDIVITRDDETERMVCHVHRPPTAEEYWRHDAYVLWDDGRSAVIRTNLALNPEELAVLQKPEFAKMNLALVLDDMILTDKLTQEASKVLQLHIAQEGSDLMKNIADQMELAEEESRSGIGVDTITQLIRDHVLRAMEGGYGTRYWPIAAATTELYFAYVWEFLQRDAFLERHIKLFHQGLDEVDASGASFIPSDQVQALLGLLDAVREF